MYTPKNLRRWYLPENYWGAQWPEYFSSGFGQSRDSDALERSNFIIALQRLGGETDTVKVVRESHWAVGWVEWIAIHESDAKALQIADELRDDYAQYPVLDENHYSVLEQEDADELWRGLPVKERIDYIRKFREQFDFRDFADLLGCVRGRYFAGYASELLC